MRKFNMDDLKCFQSESLHDKIGRSVGNIAEWFSYWDHQVYVSFSGGKDSTVLADMCAQWCSIIKKPLYLVFVNTGLEYPEIQKFVKEYAQYLRDKYDIEVVLEILRPKMRFDEVIKKYGYPIISKEVAKTVYDGKRGVAHALKAFEGKMLDGSESKYRKRFVKYKSLIDTDYGISHKCCDVMKKKPVADFEKRTGRHGIAATLAQESSLRTLSWLEHGCNAFDAKTPKSAPMSFWTEQDVLWYIKTRNIPIATVYGDVVYEKDPDQTRLDLDDDVCGRENLKTTGCQRTGCIFCAFGCHLEKGLSRFQTLKETHPRQYEYCIGGGEHDENGVWVPNKEGLGLGHVFDDLNRIYGERFINYK